MCLIKGSTQNQQTRRNRDRYLTYDFQFEKMNVTVLDIDEFTIGFTITTRLILFS